LLIQHSLKSGMDAGVVVRRDEVVYRPASHLLNGGDSDDLQCLRRREGNSPLQIEQHNSVRRSLKHRAIQPFGLAERRLHILPFSDITRHRVDQIPSG